MWQTLPLIIIYLIPALSLLLYPLKKPIEFGRVHSFFGCIEWFLSFFRDGILAAVLLGYTIYMLVMAWGTLFTSAAQGDGWAHIQPIVYPVFAALSVWSFINRRRRIRKFLGFVAGGFLMEPGEFFRLYFASISGLPGHFPEKPRGKLKLPLDYSCGDRKISIWPIIPGIAYTGIIARLVIRASKWKNFGCGEDMGYLLTTIWAAKVLQLAGARLDVEGADHLKNVSGRSIFVCNHKSFLDFAVVPLAIGLVNVERKEPFRARYMAARDHFYDNQFLYRVVGMGRAMEKMGTIFVDRKSKKKRAVGAVDDAVKAMTSGGVDVVMYPQGTRAYGNVDAGGKRIDAGYYTTGSADHLVKERGHIKKGAAYLAVDAAAILAGSGNPLNVIPVGVKGTGVVAPRGRLRVQRGMSLKIIFGSPLTLSPADMEGLARSSPGSSGYLELRKSMVEGVFAKIDEMLKNILGIHQELRKRLVFDTGRVMNKEGVGRFFEALEAWRSDQDLIFSVLDCIYSSPARMWASFLRQLCQMLAETDTPREAILAFKKIVVREMIMNR